MEYFHVSLNIVMILTTDPEFFFSANCAQFPLIFAE